MKQSNDSTLMGAARNDLRKYGYSAAYNTLSVKEANNVINNLRREFPNARLDKKTFIIYEN